MTGKEGLGEVTQAFAALADPEVRAKILIDPWRDGGFSSVAILDRASA